MNLKVSVLAKKILDHFRNRTVIGHGFNASREQLNAILDSHFAEGKRAADFAGMVGQAALCLFFTLYLFHYAESEGINFLYRAELRMSAFVFCVLYIYITIKTFLVVVYFFIRDASNNKTVFGKIYPILISLVLGVSFQYGQYTVVKAVANANALLK